MHKLRLLLCGMIGLTILVMIGLFAFVPITPAELAAPPAVPAGPVHAAGQAGEPQPAEPQPGQRAVVRVTVATLWKEPGRLRPIDGASATVPTDVSGWVSRMTVAEKLELIGKVETQVLLGQEVEVLERRDDWVRVAAVGQDTPKHPSGYPGWLPASQLALPADSAAPQAGPYVLTAFQTAWLYAEPDGRSRKMEVSFNTRLPFVRESGDWLGVAAPADGLLWMRKGEGLLVRTAEDAPRASGERLVESARSFLGLPYLWGGTSGYGFDCSGFTHTLYGYYGIRIPREAADQAQGGQAVARNALKPGDLLFFADSKGKGTVQHTAIYIGGGQMIHSPRTERSVEIVAMNAPGYGEEYAGARRYLAP